MDSKIDRDRTEVRNMTSTVVRRLTADEVDAWRALRLRALTDTPMNFGGQRRCYRSWRQSVSVKDVGHGQQVASIAAPN
jgi:hypothetical protein